MLQPQGLVSDQRCEEILPASHFSPRRGCLGTVKQPVKEPPDYMAVLAPSSRLGEEMFPP